MGCIKFTKKSVALIATIAIILIFVIIATVLLLGNYGVAKALEQFTPPIMVVLVLEISVPILFVASFFVNKKYRTLLRLYGIVILVSLFGFYFFIPFNPVFITPNHPDEDWDSGSVVHILPSVNDNRMLIKISFTQPINDPKITVDSTDFPGVMTDTKGLFWSFDIQNLQPDTNYILILKDSSNQQLCDPWPLKTFPSPDSTPESLRIVAFTGSGGHDACRSWYGMGQLPLSIRKCLINKAISYAPDILIGTGDQIYYDIKYGIGPNGLGKSRRAMQYSGFFDFDKPVLGTENEEVLKRAVDNQISYLYGTVCRSTPTYFILDDHDYFANDEANEADKYKFELLIVWSSPYSEGGIAFPPEPFLLELGRTAQNMYLPEYLPDPNRPLDLPGTGAPDRAEGVSECFGTLRYGKLVEGLIYDLRRYVTLTGENATFIPLEAEEWLKDRMAAEDAQYVINISPISYGWSAGKWLSWYPDIKTTVDGQPVLTKDISKYMWQEGWFKQHNRILNAAYEMEESKALFICGDMHTQTAGTITKSGTLDFRSDPIPSILVGSLGANGGSYPSGGLRGIEAVPPTDLIVDEALPSYEKSGFVVIDITTDGIEIRFIGWRLDMDPVDAIGTLEPHFTYTIHN